LLPKPVASLARGALRVGKPLPRRAASADFQLRREA